MSKWSLYQEGRRQVVAGNPGSLVSPGQWETRCQKPRGQSLRDEISSYPLTSTCMHAHAHARRHARTHTHPTLWCMIRCLPCSNTIISRTFLTLQQTITCYAMTLFPPFPLPPYYHPKSKKPGFRNQSKAISTRGKLKDSKFEASLGNFMRHYLKNRNQSISSWKQEVFSIPSTHQRTKHRWHPSSHPILVLGD